MRIHCPQYDGRLVRRRQLRPSLFGLLRHVLRRALTSADSDAYRYAYARTHAGTVSKPYDARALAGARKSYVAADDSAPSWSAGVIGCCRAARGVGADAPSLRCWKSAGSIWC